MKLPEPKKLPSGNYNIMLRLGGKNYSITEADPTTCTNKARLIKSEYKAGKRISYQNRNDPTIQEILDQYIASRKAVLSPSTIRGYQTIAANRFPSYKTKRPSAIKNWQTVINDEVKDGVSAKTIKNSWSLLAAALEFADLPVPSVKLPAIMPAVRPWLDAEQVKVFVSAVQGQDCEIPALLALHSLRRSEIVGLQWSKINLEKKTIRIEGSAVFNEDNKLSYKETNKSRNSRRTVPIMIPELEKALMAIPEEKRTGSVVTCNPNTIWAQINRICSQHDLPAVGVHGLRHSFASLAHHVGLPEQDAMLIGGWEDAQTMHKIYEHISAADRLKAENKLASFFKNADAKQGRKKGQNADENADDIA